MPATYKPAKNRQTHSTLTVGELIQILAKQPLSAPVVLTDGGKAHFSVELDVLTNSDGCVVLDVERGRWFQPHEWLRYGNGGRDG